MDAKSNISSYSLSFELSPIIFVDGIASNMPNKRMPIIQLTENLTAQSAQATGIVSGIGSDIGYAQNALNPLSPDQSLDKAFASFVVVSGGSLQENQIATYPFANMRTAANAVIGQPLHISLKMEVHARKQGSMLEKLARMTALKNAFETHNFSGGSYIIMTPAFVYQNCLMTAIKDVSKSVIVTNTQVEWQLDFIQPLVATEDAAATYNTLMSRIAVGSKMTAAPTNSGV